MHLVIYSVFLKHLSEEIQTVQDEINRLQRSFTEDLASNSMDSDMADQLAMHSSLAVLAERMATIQMKATGKRQLLEVVSLVALVTLHFANITFTLAVLCSRSVSVTVWKASDRNRPSGSTSARLVNWTSGWRECTVL